MNKDLIIPIIIAILVVLFIYDQYLEYRRRQLQREKEYELKYKQIFSLIAKAEVCNRNYDLILAHLIDLGQMRHKNREKTEVLTMKFFMRFAPVSRHRVLETLNKSQS